MKSARVISPQAKEPKAETWSNCRTYGNQFFISGMTAHDLAGGVVGSGTTYSQSKVVFEKIKALVEAAGGHMDDIVKMNIYVIDISEREEVWRARAEFFTGDFPCSTLVEISALAIPALTVEIEATGFIGSSSNA